MGNDAALITGDTLIGWGYKPGKWFSEAIDHANDMASRGFGEPLIRSAVASMAPPEVVTAELRTNALPFSMFIDAETEEEAENVRNTVRAMDELMRVPTVVGGVILPDAMPAPGSIPVGGVAVCEDAIHPGFHSPDICCSVAMTVLKRNEDVSKVLDAAMAVTHFGGGGRAASFYRQSKELKALLASFADNRFLKDLEEQAGSHFMTQGDGNHFLYVGTLESTGQTVIVTHHGSRGFGASLYNRGMKAAIRHKNIHAPRLSDKMAWIKADSETGEAYWDALQKARAWTKLNHFAIHDALAKKIGNKVESRTWNEHNFVFRKSDGLFYHGKGATPNWAGFAEDDDGTTLIPLNMAAPILVSEHVDKKEAFGFAPHGAGRNTTRTAFMRSLSSDPRGMSPRDQAEYLEEMRGRTGVDARFYSGVPDLSELPGAYKDADSVTAQIDKYGLAKIVDRVLPGGSIMAGDWQRDAPWRKKKDAKRGR